MSHSSPSCPHSCIWSPSPYPLLVFSTSLSLPPPCQPLGWSPAFDGISQNTGMLQWTLMELQSQSEHRRCFVHHTPVLWVYPCGNNTAQRGHAWPTEEQQVCHSLKGPAVLSSASIMSALETKYCIIIRIKSTLAEQHRKEQFWNLLMAKKSCLCTTLHNCALKTHARWEEGGWEEVFLIAL